MARPHSRLVLAVLLVLLPASARGYETDQYSGRDQALGDAVDLLNEAVNSALGEIAEGWDHGPDRRRFARAVYVELGGRHWVDHIERWAIRNPAIDKVDSHRHRSIYRGLPIWATRVNFLFGVGPTVKVAGSRIGTDKLGHFISQGWKYHRRWLRGDGVDGAVRLGVRNESTIFGSPSTGAFSNADLVANYEGFLFYRSLFEDGVVRGQPAIVRFVGRGAVVQRPFDFRDHVNDYWDEALNPNRFDRLLRGPMLRRLSELCPVYAADPGLWVSRDEESLRRRYASIGLRDGTSFRLDHVCGAARAGAPAALAAAGEP
jgi:hypothetical protein